MPGSLSRTSTHAIAVPITMLIAATMIDEYDGELEGRRRLRSRDGMDQKPLKPSACERHTTAASGISTMMLR